MIEAITEVVRIAGVEALLVVVGLLLGGFILWDLWRQERRGVERTG